MIVIVLIVLVKIYEIKLMQDANVLALCIQWTSISMEWVGFFLFQYQELNSGINCIERLHDMSIPVQEEPSYLQPLPPTGWPTTGQIELRHVNLRYREGLPLVLKDVSLVIRDREKVGLVGRTGSGKSTTILALKRMIDIDIDADSSSAILIDGKSIYEVGLKYSRQATVLIPQDPFLLSGSVRSNIDPNSQFKDADIESILKKTYIFDNLLESIGRSTATTLATDSKQGKEKNNKVEQATEVQTLPMLSERVSLVTSDSTKTRSVLDY